MAAQTMINNGCTAVAYIDNDTEGVPFDIFFYDTTGSNPSKYTVAKKWDATDGNFRDDVAAMANNLLDRGLPATDLVVGAEVAAYIQSDETLLKLLDNRRAEYGRLAPQVRYPGVVWIGNLNFDGTDLDIFSVRETVQDKTGSVSLFPATSAMVTAPNCGHMMYGRIDQIEDDKQFHSFAMQRVPKFIVDLDKDTRKLRLASRPVAAPFNKAPWMYAANVVGA